MVQQAAVLRTFDAWLDAGLCGKPWSEPLTSSLGVTGAKALALGVAGPEGAVRLIGWSHGAPAFFLNLCADIFPAAQGGQERVVTEMGRLAWFSQSDDERVITLFALYEVTATPEYLGELSSIARKVVSAQPQRQMI